MSKKNKSFQKTKQEKLEQEQAYVERYKAESDTKRVLKTVGIAFLSILLIASFCFPAVSILMQ